MKATRICSLADCNRGARTRGLCDSHYNIARRKGTLPLLTAMDRFMALVEKSGDCWLWTGTKVDGYGRFRDRGRLLHMAHRWILLERGIEIPEGWEVDHLCRTPACVNPEHLEPVTPRENWLRSAAPTVANLTKTHCPQGHPYEGDNLYIVPASGGRSCVTCRRERDRKRWAS